MKDHKTQKDDAQAAPPPKAKAGGEQERAHRHADGHAPARPDLLRDERLAHPANAEPLAGLLSQLQQSHGNAYVQRYASESGAEKRHEPKAAEPHSQPLDAGVRSQMESAFGEGFGDVRVHTGEQAGEVAEGLGARAFTHGRDIYFREGEYNPSTREGQELLAHELTHVVQQRGGSSSRGASVGPAGDTFEQEADEIAASAVRGERVHVEQRTAASDVRRQQQAKKTQPPSINTWPWLWLEPNTTREEHFPDYIALIRYESVEGASFETLHVTVPAGVSVTVVDLSGMGMQVQDPGGTAARVIVVRVNRQAGNRVIQFTFTKGSRVDISTFKLWVKPAAKSAAPKGKAAEPDPIVEIQR